MAVLVRPRPEWDDAAVHLGDTFRLHRPKCGGAVQAACRLMSHPLGWELRLEVSGSFVQSQVCPTEQDALNVSEQWKAGLVEKGWR